MPAFHKHKEITWSAHVDESDQQHSRYDMIIGRDLLTEIGIDIDFSTHTCMWDNRTIPMRNSGIEIKQSYLVEESWPIKQATTRLKNIGQ